MKSSVRIWPQSKKIAEEMVIPLSLSFRPFDNSYEINAVPNQNVSICPKCKTCVTAMFRSSKNNKLECPFCNAQIAEASKEQLSFSDFCIEQVSKPMSFKICFVFDARCADEFIAISKLYISIGLRAVLPGTKFLFLCLYNSHVSFLKIRGGRCIFIDFPITANIFNLVSIDNFMNSSEDVETIIESIAEIKNLGEIVTASHFENMFIPMPPDIFINFVVFTPFNIDVNKIPNMSIDIISPTPFKTNPNINGTFFSQQSVEDLSLQVQALVQRLSPNNFALNVTLSVAVSPLIEVTPSYIQRPSIRSGFSQVFHVNLSKITSAINEIPIEIVTSYDVPISNKQAIHRVVVTSRKFQTSKNFYSILSSVDPVTACQGMQLTNDFVKNLFNFYMTKICLSIPGTVEPDPYFTLIPSLRWFMRFFIYQKKGFPPPFLNDRESDLTCFFPQITFWDDQNTLSEDSVCSVSFEQELIGEPLIVIVDSNYKIDIFTDEAIEPESELSKFVQRKVSNRFPVPRVATKPRSKLMSLIPPEEEWGDVVRTILSS